MGWLFTGKLTHREALVYIAQLPEDSRTQTLLRDRQNAQPAEPNDGPVKFGPWRTENYQLAALTDAVRRLEITLVRVNGNDEKYPDPSPRPGIGRPVRRQSVANVTYLSKLRAQG